MQKQIVLRGISEKYHIALSKVEVLNMLFDDIGVQKVNGHTWKNMRNSLSDILSNKHSSRIAGSRVLNMVFKKTPILDQNNQISVEGEALLKEMAEELYLPTP